jgi:hypothetical protein
LPIRKYAIAAICSILALLFLSLNLCAQKNGFLKKGSFQISRNDLVWGNRLNDKPINEINPAYISTRILRNFNKTFENANDARWFVGNNFFLVGFNKNGRKSTALFSKNGGIIYNISYGSEKHLPYEEKKLMKTFYYDYNITSATEVSVKWDKIAWIVTATNGKKLIKVRFYLGNMDELENYNTDPNNNKSAARATF